MTRATIVYNKQRPALLSKLSAREVNLPRSVRVMFGENVQAVVCEINDWEDKSSLISLTKFYPNIVSVLWHSCPHAVGLRVPESY